MKTLRSALLAATFIAALALQTLAGDINQPPVASTPPASATEPIEDETSGSEPSDAEPGLIEQIMETVIDWLT
jgi:hypothetical protein